LSSEQKVFITKLNRIKDYQFKVEFDLPCMPELVTDETEPLGKNAQTPPACFLRLSAIA
jgi:hypothetical protein